MVNGEEFSRLGDADLVARARAGEDEPYAELFRRHQPAAIALARTLTDRAAADDVVAEAFEKLLMRIRAGGGPQSAFRPYLLQTVRTVAVDTSRRVRRLVVADDPESEAEPEAPVEDALFDTVYERTTLARAFSALPERWQTFLWLSFVEGADRQEIGTILGINPGGVSALGYRAREGLRRAYLDAHLLGAPTRDCGEVWPLLSGAVRGGLTSVQRKRVDHHVTECTFCSSALAELDSVNSRLGVVLAPLVLGAAAPAYLDVMGQAHAAAQAAGSVGAGSAGAASAGAGSLESGSLGAAGSGAAKVSLLGLAKTGAAGMAVVASTSTVALVGILAIFTAPLGSEPSASPRPGQVVTDAASEPGSRPPTGAGSTTGGAVVTPAVATSDGVPTSGTTVDGTPTSGPTGLPTTVGPTATGLPTSYPTSYPTSFPTPAPSTPTAGPTKKPTSTPSATDGPTASPTTEPTTGNTATDRPTGSTPTSSPTVQPTVDPTEEVAARLGDIDLAAHDQQNLPMNVTIPVALSGGSADLEVMVSVAGLTNFETAAGGSYAAWTCDQITPMAGNPKVARLQCTLPGAAPSGPLALGLNISYVGDDASVSAALTVHAPVVDSSSGDDSASVALPPKNG